MDSWGRRGFDPFSWSTVLCKCFGTPLYLFIYFSISFGWRYIYFLYYCDFFFILEMINFTISEISCLECAYNVCVCVAQVEKHFRDIDQKSVQRSQAQQTQKDSLLAWARRRSIFFVCLFVRFGVYFVTCLESEAEPEVTASFVFAARAVYTENQKHQYRWIGYR